MRRLERNVERIDLSESFVRTRVVARAAGLVEICPKRLEGAVVYFVPIRESGEERNESSTCCSLFRGILQFQLSQNLRRVLISSGGRRVVGGSRRRFRRRRLARGGRSLVGQEAGNAIEEKERCAQGENEYTHEELADWDEG